jgi:hypothetical protein
VGRAGPAERRLAPYKLPDSDDYISFYPEADPTHRPEVLKTEISAGGRG